MMGEMLSLIVAKIFLVSRKNGFSNNEAIGSLIRVC
jgi:hypothetical protein